MIDEIYCQMKNMCSKKVNYIQERGLGVRK